MKIGLICPSNILYMPYIDVYEKLLKTANVDYDIINWDRFQIECSKDPLKFRDYKVGHRRNYFDYYKYKSFIIETLDTHQYDKVIVFGLQITFFLKKYLIKNFKNNFILDIRDHNQLLNFFEIKKLVKNSFITVLSSPAYKEWLPKLDKYVVNHNTNLNNFNALTSVKDFNRMQKKEISYIGAIRDYKVNIKLIESMKKSKNFNLMFHGEGTINKSIKKHIDKKGIGNVVLTGKYSREEEKSLYDKSDIVNVLRFNDGINNKTALPNRLYSAAMNGKVLLALEGTYLSEVIAKYNLGIILKSFNDVEEALKDYLQNFSFEKYQDGRASFLKEVAEDNQDFEKKISKFFE